MFFFIHFLSNNQIMLNSRNVFSFSVELKMMRRIEQVNLSSNDFLFYLQSDFFFSIAQDLLSGFSSILMILNTLIQPIKKYSTLFLGTWRKQTIAREN